MKETSVKKIQISPTNLRYFGAKFSLAFKFFKVDFSSARGRVYVHCGVGPKSFRSVKMAEKDLEWDWTELKRLDNIIKNPVKMLICHVLKIPYHYQGKFIFLFLVS